jgi:hypothetical protein
MTAQQKQTDKEAPKKQASEPENKMSIEEIEREFTLQSVEEWTPETLRFIAASWELPPPLKETWEVKRFGICRNEVMFALSMKLLMKSSVRGAITEIITEVLEIQAQQKS